jgi:hypothetical protein
MFRNLPKFWGEFDKKLTYDIDKVAEDEKRIEASFSTTFDWRNVRDFSFYGLLALLGTIIVVVSIIKYRNRASFRRNNSYEMRPMRESNNQ